MTEPAKRSTSTTISTLSQFLEEIQRLPYGQYLYRGQGQDYELKPKIARLTPPHGETPETMEFKMLLDLKRRAGAWMKDSILRPDNDWDWLALAQHHGMATRLLDWSDNPLTALFFAVEKVFEPKGMVGNQCPVVWVFRVDENDLINIDEKDQTPFAITRTRVFRPNHVTPRIVSQNGWFMAHRYLNRKGIKPGFVALEKNIKYKPSLSKFKIKPEQVGELRRTLRTCGIHAGSIYPGLEGLCADIAERHSQMKDEILRETKTAPDDSSLSEKSLKELIGELAKVAKSKQKV